MVLTSSDEDEPLIVVKPDEEGKKEAAAKRKDSPEQDSIDLPSSPVRSPAKKAKPEPAEVKQEDAEKKRKQTENGDFSDEDEEALFLALMNQHGSASYAAKPAVTPSKSAATKSTPAVKTGAAGKTKGADDGTDKFGSARVDSSKIKFSRSLPLVVPNLKRVSRHNFIVQCEDPSLDFDGDSGVIGTIKSSDNSLHLDIKGQLYDGSVLPCNTMMVVDVGPSEIRVEAVMHDFVQLHEVSNPHDEDVDVELSDDGGDAMDSDDEGPRGKQNQGGKDKGAKGKAAGKKPAKKKTKTAKKPKPAVKKKGK